MPGKAANKTSEKTEVNTIAEKEDTPMTEQDVTQDIQEDIAQSTNQVPEAHDASDQVSLKRRMPERLKKYLLRVGGNKFYLPAAYRIVWFRDEYPDWGVITNLIEGGHAAGYATVQATVQNPDGRIIASGIKTESKQDFPAGWVEKAETGAIARALAVAGFGTQFTPELDDDTDHPADSPHGGANARINMNGTRGDASQEKSVKGNRKTPGKSAGEIWNGPGLCPNCHAPDGKRHSNSCSYSPD